MISRNLSRVMIGISFIIATVITHYAFASNQIEDLKSNKKLTELGASKDWKNGNVILFIRHEERCDRSSNPCLGPEDGITLLGNQKARETGAMIRSYFKLDNSDIYTSPTTKTVQTSESMLGKSTHLPDREAICGNDIVEKLQRYKTPNRNFIIVTHSACIKDLINSSNYNGLDSVEYGVLLFARISNSNKIHIFGTLNTGDDPK